MLYGATNVPVEWELHAGQVHGDVFAQVEVDVIVERPDGQAWTVPAFWAGDDRFRVRFAGPVPGRYTLRSVCSDATDSGLHDQQAMAEIQPYTGTSPLYRHGRLRVAQSSRTFEHTDGTPFLWLGDTWWMGLTTRLDWPHGFRCLAADRVRKGFNAIQIVAGPLPDFDATIATWNRQQTNEAGWPWMEHPGRNTAEPPTPEDFVSINPAFYDLADLRISCLVEMGLMPCMVGMWGYYLPFMGVANAKRHWRNLVARYGAYPVTWCICGETTMPNYGTKPDVRETVAAEQKRGWSDVAAYVDEIDPFANLLSTHPSHLLSARQAVADESVLDFSMLQTGHSAHVSYPASLRCMAESYATAPVMPFLNSEVNYEGIMGGNWHEVQRFLFWTNMLGGACGHTYGAQGMWAMSSRNEPFRGTTFDWGEGFWQDVMHYPGSTHLGLGAEFLRRYPWQRFVPRIESLPEGRLYAHAAGIPGEIALYYFPVAYTDRAFAGMSGQPISIHPDEHFEAAWFNPRSGDVTPIGHVTPDAAGKWLPPLPSREDWVLVLEATTGKV